MLSSCSRQFAVPSASTSSENKVLIPILDIAMESSPAFRDERVYSSSIEHDRIPRVISMPVGASSANSKNGVVPLPTESLMESRNPSSSQVEKEDNEANKNVSMVASASACQYPKKTSRSSSVLDAGGESAVSGRWTAAEHEAFLTGLKVYGREWKKVSSGLGS